MKVRMERHEFADAVAWVAKHTPAHPPVPVLRGVLLTTTDDGLTVSGFDYEVSATATVSATVAHSGQALVSGRLLADITKALPAQPVEVTTDGPIVTIVCGPARFTLPTLPLQDYPSLPDQPALAGEVTGGTFAQAVAQVAVAAGKDDALPMLTGIRVELAGDTLTLAATDRFRLAIRELSWRPANTEVDTAVTVPAQMLAATAKTMSGGMVRIALDGQASLAGFAAPGRATTTQLLDVEFPAYRRLVPTEYTCRAVFDVAPLVAAIKRVALLADREARVWFEFTDTGVRLSAGHTDEGVAEEELPVDYTGDPVTIVFNPGYFTDGLAALATERAELTFTTPIRPALIKPVDDDGDTVEGYQYLVMPVRDPGRR